MFYSASGQVRIIQDFGILLTWFHLLDAQGFLNAEDRLKSQHSPFFLFYLFFALNNLFKVTPHSVLVQIFKGGDTLIVRGFFEEV